MSDDYSAGYGDGQAAMEDEIRHLQLERDALISVLRQWHQQFEKRAIWQCTWGDSEVAALDRHHDAIFETELVVS